MTELLLLLVVAGTLLIPVALLWLILDRAGFPPPLALVALFPGIGFLVVLAVLAFADWPRLPRDPSALRYDSTDDPPPYDPPSGYPR